MNQVGTLYSDALKNTSVNKYFMPRVFETNKKGICSC